MDMISGYWINLEKRGRWVSISIIVAKKAVPGDPGDT